MKLAAGLCLLAVSGSILVVCPLLTRSWQTAANAERFTPADLVFPVATAIAPCGLATLLSLFSHPVRGGLLVLGGGMFLGGALAVTLDSAVVPKQYQNAVVLPLIPIVGAGGLLVIGVVLLNVGLIAWDTTRERRTSLSLWTRTVFHSDLPPELASDVASDHQLYMEQLRRLSPGQAAAVERAIGRTAGQNVQVHGPETPPGL